MRLTDNSMFDLGRTFIASVERSPRALAIIDGDRRLTYAEWYVEICRLTG
jgi:2-furoate---CoA ligase